MLLDPLLSLGGDLAQDGLARLASLKDAKQRLHESAQSTLRSPAGATRRDATHLGIKGALVGVLIRNVQDVLLKGMLRQEEIRLAPVFGGAGVVRLLQEPLVDDRRPLLLAQLPVEPQRRKRS